MPTAIATHPMDFPAPWSLTGDGLILCYRPDAAWRAARPADWSGRLAVAMWVNYRTSPVGPYCEWLLIAGKRKNPRGGHYSISDIYVDSQDSMRGGQQNWGIPKQMAQFSWRREERSVLLSMHAENAQLQVAGELRGPSIPVPAIWQPFRLYQQRGGRHFWTRPTARGRCRWFSAAQVSEEGTAAPLLQNQRLVAALFIQDFQMTFPRAQIDAGPP